MTEQRPDEDVEGHIRRPYLEDEGSEGSGDEVEGHVRRPRTEASDDVEGHVRRPYLEDEGSGDDDVEGHTPPARRPL
jgi:hypothetical protein